jgi:hypothetical protein
VDAAKARLKALEEEHKKHTARRTERDDPKKKTERVASEKGAEKANETLKGLGLDLDGLGLN